MVSYYLSFVPVTLKVIPILVCLIVYGTCLYRSIISRREDRDRITENIRRRNGGEHNDTSGNFNIADHRRSANLCSIR